MCPDVIVCTKEKELINQANLIVPAVSIGDLSIVLS
jgi:hypothetical protein